jgi:hypothetical protein
LELNTIILSLTPTYIRLQVQEHVHFYLYIGTYGACTFLLPKLVTFSKFISEQLFWDVMPNGWYQRFHG